MCKIWKSIRGLSKCVCVCGGGGGGGGTTIEEKRGEIKDMQMGKTEKGKKREEEKKKDGRSVLQTHALLNDVVPRCLRSSLERLHASSQP